MVTVWYPARCGGGPAPYVAPTLAAELDRTATPGLGLAPGQVDWEHIVTHAHRGVPPLERPGGHPLVLYSPGVFESRAYGSGAAIDLASHGYVVVAMDHTYETAIAFPDGLRPQRVDLAGDDPVARLRKIDQVRVQDARFVLDQFVVTGARRRPGRDPRTEAFGRIIDPAAIGMFGHSGGGDASMQLMFEDRRVGAAVDMDGFLAYDSQGVHPMPVATRGVNRPYLLFGSESSVAQVPAPGTPPDWELRTHHSNPAWRQLWNASSGPGLDLAVPHGRHHVFTDHLTIVSQLSSLGIPREAVVGLIGTLGDPDRAARSIHTYVRAFFDRHLRHRRSPELDGPLPQPPDIRFIR